MVLVVMAEKYSKWIVERIFFSYYYSITIKCNIENGDKIIDSIDNFLRENNYQYRIKGYVKEGPKFISPQIRKIKTMMGNIKIITKFYGEYCPAPMTGGMGYFLIVAENAHYVS